MKSEKGVTLTSIMIYVMAFTVIVIVISRITAYFYKNINNVEDDVIAESEYAKFNSYFTQEINTEGNEVGIWENDYIVFQQSENQYKFQNNGIYRNKVKICNGISACKFEYNVETKEITVELEIKEKTYRNIYTVIK